MSESRETLAEWRETMLDDAHDRAHEMLDWAVEGNVDPAYALQVAATALGMFATMAFAQMKEMPPERVDAMLRDQLDSFVLTVRKSIGARMGERVTPEFIRTTAQLDRAYKRRVGHPNAEPGVEA